MADSRIIGMIVVPQRIRLGGVQATPLVDVDSEGSAAKARPGEVRRRGTAAGPTFGVTVVAGFRSRTDARRIVGQRKRLANFFDLVTAFSGVFAWRPTPPTFRRFILNHILLGHLEVNEKLLRSTLYYC